MGRQKKVRLFTYLYATFVVIIQRVRNVKHGNESF